MPSTLLGFSGGGEGGSSPFFGIAYGPELPFGPPASGGTSCWLGFCESDPPEGCCAKAGAAEKVAPPSKSKIVSKNAQKCALREELRMQVIENIGIGPATSMLV